MVTTSYDFGHPDGSMGPMAVLAGGRPHELRGAVMDGDLPQNALIRHWMVCLGAGFQSHGTVDGEHSQGELRRLWLMRACWI